MALEDILWGIATGGTIGILAARIIGRDIVRKLDRKFEMVVAEEVGLSYEKGLPWLVLYEIQKERGIATGGSPVLYDVDLLGLYLKRHPEKRVEWDLKKKTLRAKYLGSYMDAECVAVSEIFTD